MVSGESSSSSSSNTVLWWRQSPKQKQNHTCNRLRFYVVYAFNWTTSFRHHTRIHLCDNKFVAELSVQCLKRSASSLYLKRKQQQQQHRIVSYFMWSSEWSEELYRRTTDCAHVCDLVYFQYIAHIIWQNRLAQSTLYKHLWSLKMKSSLGDISYSFIRWGFFALICSCLVYTVPFAYD